MALTQVGSGMVAAGAVSQSSLGTGVAGNGPAFSVYLNNTQSISNGVATKIQFATEVFDTANCFDSSTNYRFTPNVAGYYQFNLVAGCNGTSMTAVVTLIYKNGTMYASSDLIVPGSPYIGTTSMWQTADLIYMNGTTDYVEFYCQINATSPTINGFTSTAPYTKASGFLARAA